MQKLFEQAEEILNERASSDVQPLVGNTVIVILGYELDGDGQPQTPLISRLKKGLEIATAEAYLEAPVIVSGDQQRNGMTESKVMANWLVEHHVKSDRIIEENQSKDTVGNVLNITKLVAKLRIPNSPNNILLVTSATHLCRAHVLLDEALRQSHLAFSIKAVSADDVCQPTEKTCGASDSRIARLAVFRDVLRVAGIWQYQGLQR
jgi:uncharacterized SAM-binding protein YcdF (DUF218 family)